MSALRETTPSVGPGNGVPVSGRSPQARRPTAKRTVGAAGQARRSMQRDLARREASLRINRRVSGASAGIVRPPLAGPAPAVPAPLPGWRPAPTVPGAPSAAEPQTAPAARVAPRLQAPPGPQGRPQGAPRLRTAAPTPAAARLNPGTAVARGATSSAAVGGHLGFASIAGAAAALAPAAAPARSDAPSPLSALTALPGGFQAAAPADVRRLSNPAVLLLAMVILVITVGTVIGLQIRMTQVSEQMGSDLAQITTLQQSNTALKERIGRQVGAARVNSAIAADGIIEPDVVDLRFVSVGDPAATAASAARNLKRAPVAPTAAQEAAAKASTATSATAATAGAAAATAGVEATIPEAAPSAAVSAQSAATASQAAAAQAQATAAPAPSTGTSITP